MPAALYGGSDRPGSVIDPKHAEAVVLAMWPLRERALHDRDLTTLRKLETGPALAADIARVCFCPPHVIRTEQNPIVVVERQSSFPAVFLGIVVTRSQTTDQFEGHPAAFIATMVFTRADSTSAWQLTIWTGYTGAYDFPNPILPHWDPADTTIPGTYAFALRPSGRPGLEISRLPAMLAAEWQSWAEHRTGLSASPFSDVSGKSVRGAVDDWSARGVSAHFVFRPDPSVSIYQFGVYTTEELACSALDYAETLMDSTPGGVLHQGAAQSNWGPAIAPGDYGAITYVGVAELCFYIQPSPAKIIVYFNALLDTGAAGKPAIRSASA